MDLSVSVCSHVFAGANPTSIGNDLGYLAASCSCMAPFLDQSSIDDLHTIHIDHIADDNNARSFLIDLPANSMARLGKDSVWKFESYPNQTAESDPIPGRRWMLRQEAFLDLFAGNTLYSLQKSDGTLASLFLSSGLEMLGVWADKREATDDANEAPFELVAKKVGIDDLVRLDRSVGLVEIRWSKLDYQLIVPLHYLEAKLVAGK